MTTDHAENRLSEAECIALRSARRGLLVSRIPDRTERDVFGLPVPGLQIYRRLERRGFLFFSEEDPVVLDDGEEFTFTPSVDLTEAGVAALERIASQVAPR